MDDRAELSNAGEVGIRVGRKVCFGGRRGIAAGESGGVMGAVGRAGRVLENGVRQSGKGTGEVSQTLSH